MTTSVVKQIADLQRMTLPELHDRWRQLMGGEPPRYRREFVIRRLAYRLQELMHGGLSDAARDRMDRILDEEGYDEIASQRRDPRRARTRRDTPVLGTRLIREWNGGSYEVTVADGGYEFEGRLYRSLTAVTKVITGAHWNGRSFFGVSPRSRKEGAR